ncbi:MAG: PAS domain S-box protein, partial [Archaeoglobaceae archaeon]
IEKFSKYENLSESDPPRFVHVYRLLKSILLINYLLPHEKEEQNLLQDVCSILNKECGYPLVWVGFTEEETKSIIPVSYAGWGEEYLERSQITYDDTPTGCGPAGTAIKTREPVIAKIEDPCFEPWRDNALDFGFQSCADIPLIANNYIYGVLVVYSGYPDAFKGEESELLEMIGNDIAFGMCSIRANEELKETLKALEQSEKKYRSVVEYSNDGIVVIQDNVIIFANSKVAEILGLSGKDVLFSNPFEKFIHPEDRKRIFEIYKRRIEGKSAPNMVSYRIIDRDDNIRWIEAKIVLVDWDGRPATLNFARDITERKQAEERMRKELMKFRMDEGNVYLVKEQTLTKSLEAFNDLLRVGFSGLIISRTPPEKFECNFEEKVDFWRIAEKGKNPLAPDPEEIGLRIEELPKKAILIDCVDYMMFKNGFKKTLSFIYNLKDVSYIKNHIAIISIDPTTINKQKMRVLEKETNEIEPKDITKLPEDLFEILKFVYRYNKTGKRPTYSELGQEVKVSKPTLRKRIRVLLNYGYLAEFLRGRSKILEITEKGRKLFLN